MLRYLFLLLALICTAATAQEKLAMAIDQVMQTAAVKDGFSGVVLVARKGQVVYHETFGYREFAEKIPMQKNDVFELASVSKQFTAMIIMMLKEKGLLQYDDAIEKYLSVPYKNITVRQLLTHTSGLPDYQQIMDQHWDKTQVAGNPEILSYLNKYAPPALFEPGEKYEYSNTGYILLASIAEQVAGIDFITQSRKAIFNKLHMRQTDIRSLKEKAATANFAIGHLYVPAQQQYVRSDSFPAADYTIWLGNRKGSGRISSTAMDLLLWDRALYTHQLVSKATMEEAFTPMKLNNGSLSMYGFGWDLITESPAGKIVEHNGDNPGYKTQIVRYIDSDQTIILLSNNAHANFGTILDALKKIITTD